GTKPVRALGGRNIGCQLILVPANVGARPNRQIAIASRINAGEAFDVVDTAGDVVGDLEIDVLAPGRRFDGQRFWQPHELEYFERGSALLPVLYIYVDDQRTVAGGDANIVIRVLPPPFGDLFLVGRRGLLPAFLPWQLCVATEREHAKATRGSIKRRV